jgi:hypothetical protein
MKVIYYTHFAPDVSVHTVTDDFGMERTTHATGTEFHLATSYTAFNAAKRFVTGMTFEEAGMHTMIPTVCEH